MPSLHLQNVPEDLYRRIEELAAADRVLLSEETLALLQQAVMKKSSTNGRRSQREVLDDIVRHRFALLPGMPSAVEMLREDRER